MAIGMIARIKIQEGKNDEFEAVFKKLEAAVAENMAATSIHVIALRTLTCMWFLNNIKTAMR